MQGGQVDPKDPTDPKGGKQPPGAPNPNPLWDGRTTPDHWEELLDKPPGTGQEG